MKTYAIVDSENNVVNTVLWEGDTEVWQPPEDTQAILLEEGSTVSSGWTYVDGEFIAPPVPPPPPPTPEEIIAGNTVYRNRLLDSANRIIPALEDAIDLEDPSANPTLLKKWKQFRVAVNKIDVTNPNPAWPEPPQEGYASNAVRAEVEQ